MTSLPIDEQGEDVLNEGLLTAVGLERPTGVFGRHLIYTAFIAAEGDLVSQAQVDLLAPIKRKRVWSKVGLAGAEICGESLDAAVVALRHAKSTNQSIYMAALLNVAGLRASVAKSRAADSRPVSVKRKRRG